MANTWQELDSKYIELKSILMKMGRIIVAFSGGVDSSLLLKVAKQVLGNDVLAVTALSETTPQHEKKAAEEFAETLGVEHLLVQSHEMDIPEFVKNPQNKCYICKKSRFVDLTNLAKERNFSYVVDGENIDDQNDYRPGTVAARELDIRSPLSEAGLSKNDIRRLSQKLNLPTWNKPSDACLASRIPYHRKITIERLRQVDAGEEFIRKLGLSGQVRVRHYGDTARIEVEPKEIQRLAKSVTRNRIIQFFRNLGFKHITLDLEGYRMGSLNRVIPSLKESGGNG
jgi:uncharacterized protein